MFLFFIAAGAVDATSSLPCRHSLFESGRITYVTLMVQSADCWRAPLCSVCCQGGLFLFFFFSFLFLFGSARERSRVRAGAGETRGAGVFFFIAAGAVDATSSLPCRHSLFESGRTTCLLGRQSMGPSCVALMVQSADCRWAPLCSVCCQGGFFVSFLFSGGDHASPQTWLSFFLAFGSFFSQSCLNMNQEKKRNANTRPRPRRAFRATAQ